MKKLRENKLDENRFENKEIKEKHPLDKIKCEICGKIVCRAAMSKHRKSERHKMYDEMNKKIYKLLMN